MPGLQAASAAGALVGRGEQQRVLEGLRDALREGRGSGALLVGEPGVGKSTLLEWHLADLAATTVVRVDVDPDLPGLGLERLLGELDIRVPVTGMPADLRQAAADPAALAVVEEVSRRLDEVLLTQPVVLAVEDLQWGSPTLLVALRRLAPMTEDRPLHMVATRRLTRPSPVLARTLELLDRASFVSLAVDGLESGAVVDLVEVLAGGRPVGRFRRLVDQAGGNPLLIRELVRSLGDDLAIRPNGTVDLAVDAAPTVAGSWVTTRLDQLSREAAQLCRVAAVLGTSGEASELAALLDRRELELLDPLAEAVAAGILTESGGRIRFSHELLREAIHRELPEPLRRSLHGDAARVVGGVGGDPVRVAYHRSFDLRADDDAGLELIADAVRRVAGLDPEAALGMIERASAGGGVEVASQLAPLRAEPLAWLGRVRDAVQIAEESIADTSDPDERRVLGNLLADLLVTQGRAAEMVDVLVRVHAELPEGDPRRASAAAEAALARFTAGDLDGARALAEEAVADGNEATVVRGRVLLARIAAHAHRYRTGATEGWAAAESADAEPTGTAHRNVPWFFCALTCFDRDSPDAARALAAGRDRVDSHATYWATPLYDGLAAAMAYREGRLDDCLAEAAASYETGLETGSVQAMVWALSHRALIEIDRGDAEASETLAEADRWFSTGRALLGADHYYLARARERAGTGDANAAFEELDGAWRLFEALRLFNCQPLLAPDLVRLSLARDERGRAIEVAAEMTRVAALDEAPGMDAIADWCVGLVERRPDRVASAGAAFGALGRSLDETTAGIDEAILLSEAGRASDAAAVGERVVATVDALDLTALRRRLDGGFDSDSAARSGRPARPRFGWDSLTRTERAIVELVASGMTNAEIAAARVVSTRTVESHLHRVYTKLAIETRTRLAVEAAQHLPRAR